MRRKFRWLARRNAPTSSRFGAAPDQAEEPRRLPRGIALLVAVVLLLALAPSASASIQFVKQWGSQAPGTASSMIPTASPPTPRATSTSPTPTTTGSRSSTPPATFMTKWGSSGSGDGQFNSLRRRHRLLGQRLRRRHRQRPDPEVRLLGQLHHQVGELRLRGRPVRLPRRRRHRLLGQRLRRRHH